MPISWIEVRPAKREVLGAEDGLLDFFGGGGDDPLHDILGAVDDDAGGLPWASRTIRPPAGSGVFR
jgi:hypothetical protein